MHTSFHFTVLLLLILALGTQTDLQAQPDQAEEISAQEYADRARRLREFGYPELARAQLQEAARRHPTELPVVLEHLRLLSETRAPVTEIEPWIRLVQTLYPGDFECALELATWIYVNERPPEAPIAANDEALQYALRRLAAEMEVYRELAAFIHAPGDRLPASAALDKRPALPLAYLARCAYAKPRRAEVDEFAARYLELMARRFQSWAFENDALEPFHDAATELYELAVPLYRRIEGNREHAAFARQRLTEILFRMGRHDEALKQAATSDLFHADSLTVASVLQSIAEYRQDWPLLIDALQRFARVYRDETAMLDLRAARRVRDESWPFAIWLAWQEMRALPGHHRAGALQALLADRPQFVELHYVDAGLRVEVAMAESSEESARILDAALRALERCREIAAEVPGWYGLQATILWQLQRYEEAAQAFWSLAQAEPDDRQAARYAKAAQEIAQSLYTAADWAQYRSLMEEIGDFREKMAELKGLTARAPKFFEAQLLLSKVALMLEDFETSLGAAHAALEIAPDNLECLDNGAWSAMWLGRYREAAALFARMDAQSPNYRDSARWFSLVGWAAGAGEDEQQAFQKWLESTKQRATPVERRQLLDEAARLAPRFPEPALELAQLEQARGEFQAAEALLDRALEHARDNWVRAAIHRARGNLFRAGRRVDRAVAEYESAYNANVGDGGDLLLAALALHATGDDANASAAMRRLFQESPGTPLLRPTPEEIHLLDLMPVEKPVARETFPAYGVGEKLSFQAAVTVFGEGKGQPGEEVTIRFDMHVEVLEVPRHGGVWELALAFNNAPSDEWKAIEQARTTIRVSPWFGLCEEPMVPVLADVINPVIQALVEGLTAGMGDSTLPVPHVWKNTLTKGPPHFGSGDPSGSYIESAIGDSFTIVRRALAGRRLGQGGARDATFSRALEARVEAGGPRRALRKVSFEVSKEELAPERDDVIRSRLEVSITAR